MAVVAVSQAVPLTAFCLELRHSLLAGGEGAAARLTSADILAAIGPQAFEPRHEYRYDNDDDDDDDDR